LGKKFFSALHFGRFLDKIFGQNFWTKFLDKIFGQNFWTKVCDFFHKSLVTLLSALQFSLFLIPLGFDVSQQR
jgi:hypothetical protein